MRLVRVRARARARVRVRVRVRVGVRVELVIGLDAGLRLDDGVQQRHAARLAKLVETPHPHLPPLA